MKTMKGYTIKASVEGFNRTYEIEEESELKALLIVNNYMYAAASDAGIHVDEYTERTFTISKSRTYTGKEHSWTQYENGDPKYKKKHEGYVGPICDKCGFSFNLKDHNDKWTEKSCK